MRMRKIEMSELKHYLSPYERKGFLPHIEQSQQNNAVNQSIANIDKDKMEALASGDTVQNGWPNLWANLWGKLGNISQH